MILNVLLGVRGVAGHDTKDFFTMRPFSSPIVRCTVSAFLRDGESRDPLPFPDVHYVRFPSAITIQRRYLETLPLYAEGMRKVVQRLEPRGESTMTCVTLHDTPPRTFHF